MTAEFLGMPLLPGSRGLGLYILNDDGEPQLEKDTLTWAYWMEAARDRVLLQNWIGPERGRQVKVSTVFLGVDYRHIGPGPPLLFETMVFGGPFDHAIRRYPSGLDALRGHAGVVALVDAFNAAPRKTKKALRKFGARYCTYTSVGLVPGDVRRVRRVLVRAGW